jgi:hypothetical protein
MAPVTICGCDSPLMTNDDMDSSSGLRASFLIKFAATVQNMAHVAMYATQFMLTLCGIADLDIFISVGQFRFTTENYRNISFGTTLNILRQVILQLGYHECSTGHSAQGIFFH